MHILDCSSFRVLTCDNSIATVHFCFEKHVNEDSTSQNRRARQRTPPCYRCVHRPANCGQRDPLTTNDTASTISYSAGWTYTAVSGYYSSDAQYANAAGATATFSFTGTTIDTYSATTILQQTIFSASGLAAGAHQVIVTLRSDTSGTGYFTDVDAFATDQATFSGTRYIDNASGSGCSDNNAGTSTSAPRYHFAPVQDSALAAGSNLLLARGDTWTSPLRLSGTGTSSSWITPGAYGSGTAGPIIKGTNQTTDRTVILTNPTTGMCKISSSPRRARVSWSSTPRSVTTGSMCTASTRMTGPAS